MTYEHISRQFGVGLYSSDDRSLGLAHNPQAAAAVRNLFEIDLRLRAAGALFDPEEAFIQGRAFEELPISSGRAWNHFYNSNNHIGHQNAAARPLEFLMLPTVGANRAPFGTYYRASQYISMTVGAANRDLAARFIDFFVNDLEGNRILLAERGVPIPTNVWDDLHSRVDANNRYLFDIINRIAPFVSPTDPPYPPAAGEAMDAMRPFHLQILTGRLPLDPGFNQMVNAANTVLSR
jgi:multiple sugar transport system substrate-binding protein